MIRILGISCFYHDSSVTLLENGNISYAIQEERFSRIKHDSNFPSNAIRYILKKNKITLSEIDYIVFYEKPFLKFERLLETYLKNIPFGLKSFIKSLPLWLKEKLFQKLYIEKKLKIIDPDLKLKNQILFSEHHLSHASSAFYPSKFKNSAILTMDGVGEWATTTIAIGKDNKIEMQEEINFPHSLGLLYSAFTYFCGFEVNGGEYKLMGLAPYGTPKYYEDIMQNLIKVKQDGSFKMNMKYFNYQTGFTMINKKFENLFKKKARIPSDKIECFYADMAASVQKVVEEIIIKICKYIKQKYKTDNLCLAGGVALNCVANSKILKEKLFKDIWIQPASGDAGGSLGAALETWYGFLGKKRVVKCDDDSEDSMNNSFLGRCYSNEQVINFLDKNKIEYEKLHKDDIYNKITNILLNQKIVALFKGREEFGPRALGNRSIIADPRDENMQKKMNLKIKYRESFRPFAPIILEDSIKDWFPNVKKSPYMLLVDKIIYDKRFKYPKNCFFFDKIDIKNSLVPAVTHVDYSSRIQTINKKNNFFLYNLLKTFEKETSCPILVNTSFNIKDEPIVSSLKDAYSCFKSTEIDYLLLENCLIKNPN